MLKRWKQSAGYPFMHRVIYTVPRCWLTGTADAWNWMGGHVYRLDAFCRRCAWRRKHYGFKEYMRRTWHDED